MTSNPLLSVKALSSWFPAINNWWGGNILLLTQLVDEFVYGENLLWLGKTFVFSDGGAKRNPTNSRLNIHLFPLINNNHGVTIGVSGTFGCCLNTIQIQLKILFNIVRRFCFSHFFFFWNSVAAQKVFSPFRTFSTNEAENEMISLSSRSNWEDFTHVLILLSLLVQISYLLICLMKRFHRILFSFLLNSYFSVIFHRNFILTNFALIFLSLKSSAKASTGGNRRKLAAEQRNGSQQKAFVKRFDVLLWKFCFHDFDTEWKFFVKLFSNIYRNL